MADTKTDGAGSGTGTGSGGGGGKTAKSGGAATVFVTVHYIEFTKTSKTDKTVRVPLPLGARTVSPVCEVKRFMHKLTGVHPTQQRLKLVGSVDAFNIPATVRMTRRPAREPVWDITIEGMTSYDDEKKWRWKFVCDPTDTILDMKFWLSERLGGAIPAEVIQLYTKRPEAAVQSILAGSETLLKIGLKSGSVLKVHYVIPSTTKGHGAIHRTEPELVAYDDPNNQTICSNFRLAAAKFSARPYLGTRSFGKTPGGERGPYVWQTYGQISARVSAFGAGLRSLGLEAGDTIGIMSLNRAEWVITDLACATQSFLSVPLYDTLGPDATHFIVNHASVKAVVVCKEKLSEISGIRSKCPTLQHVIVMNEYPSDIEFVQKSNRGAVGFTHSFTEIEALGQPKITQFPDCVPRPTDLVTICYTSGTTGNPKGVMLSHRSILSAAVALSNRLPRELEQKEVLLSYLPLAHIYARVVEASLTGRGHAIGFYAGDPQKLVEDVAVLRPTIFPGVPRVWQRIYDRVTTQVADGNFVTRYLFNKAYAAKQDAMRRGDESLSTWGDRIVFSKIAQRFGGNLKVMASGAAPLSPKIAEFMHLAFMSGFAEGYGLTETSGGATATHIKDVNFGCVGAPIAANEIKLVDVPDMDYLVSDKPNPRGEIWIRGVNVFNGYYKQPDITAEVLDDDGWFRTGDVGMWLPSGDLKIIDRKKNIFKTQQGEYIRPEYIEGVMKQVKYIANIFVHGSGLENYLVAVVVPNFETVTTWCNQNGLAAVVKAGPAEMAKNEKIRKLILRSMQQIGEQEKLRGFEVVKDITLTHQDFTVENGLLTPSFKLKRHQCVKTFESVLNAMYARTNAALAAAGATATSAGSGGSAASGAAAAPTPSIKSKL